ncbi:threonine--tRNA ligase [Dehalobacterium formicoaceticum]|uniref:Threonine--tRNA ligase n=1 Tax=Dehalobacterium formicoaceticum TaxID=51515 RepID=A0ABT1Y7F9_9FIRM|nr:threonine--tRNA ligase [Dehalobacterium formicoaceticum]MCR6546830.1 threonine--tRNA ligase [Dehalobacterium formicoaceticum]
MISVTLPDGAVKTVPENSTAFQILESISKGLAKNAVAAKVNGKVTDLSGPINEDVTLEALTFEDEDGQHTFRHSSSHILAQAVQRLFPGTKLAIGPAIQDGFYYDFDSDHTFTPEDLTAIEEEMKKIVKEDNEFHREILSREDALSLFNEKGETYKLELIRDLPEESEISIYRNGDFVDLCAGPHITDTGKVKAFKLTSLAGAYWRGNEKNKMLQRIYGTSFPKKSMLDDYLFRIEEAKKRDHRKIGAELELFTIMEEGPGFPFFLPKGMILRNELENFWREEHGKWGYQEIKTPMILNQHLWEQSGHWDHYQDNMYFTKIDEQNFAVKPMNCPGGMLVYKSKMHSYRELPLRFGELGLVHRHELSGALHGLMRVRCFTQDDAHIFMLPSQIKDEIKNVYDLIDSIYRLFGFNYHVELSTRPENSMGSAEVWEEATEALRQALIEKDVPFKVNEGDGAFYGPKIDFHLQDSLGRTWQCGTIQLDFQMPEKFDLTYIGEDGQKHRPVMIHRVAFGSIERFIGILIEHFAGAFPLWLAPVQVKVLPITDKHAAYGEELTNQLSALGIRAELDGRNEKIGYKIREARNQRIPYMFVVGDKEMAEGTVAVRKRGEEIGALPVHEITSQLIEEIKTKKID